MAMVSSSADSSVDKSLGLDGFDDDAICQPDILLSVDCQSSAHGLHARKIQIVLWLTTFIRSGLMVPQWDHSANVVGQPIVAAAGFRAGSPALRVQ
jgi:hypothetical protein